MSTFGWQSPNWSPSWKFFGWNTDNNVSTGSVSFPENGTITAIVFNCGQLSGSFSQSMSAQGCLWDPSGNLLVAGAAVTLPVVGQGPGPYSWSSSSCNFHVTTGTRVCLGWWRNPAQAAGNNIWGFGSGGTELRGTTANSGAAGAFAQDASASDQIGVYVVYTPDSSGTGGGGAPPRQIQNRAYVYELMREGLLP